MVVGSGAPGNEVLKNLALLNTGNIFLVDFDNIEYSNLSRSVLFRESDIGRPKVEVAVLDASFPYKDMSLQEIGIPPLQILTVATKEALFAVELTGDLGFIH